MNVSNAAPGALADLRVLDLTDHRFHYCGKLLADLGAEVIKIEPPGGDAGRRRGPFKGDLPHPEGSLPFAYHNTNKKSVVLDLMRPQDRSHLRRLVEGSDALLESFAPGFLAELGLDYATLAQLNPALVFTSLSGFGQTGPYKGFKAPDLVSFAMSGAMYICGLPDGPPTVAPWEQANLMASLHGAFGTLLALYGRRASGRGQWVEVSAQEALAAEPLLNQITRYSLTGEITPRTGSQSNPVPGRLYPALDGHVYIEVNDPPQWRRFLEWLGFPESLRDPIWEDRPYRRQHLEELNRVICEHTQRYPKTELFHSAQARAISLGPVCTPEEFIANEHSRARGLFVEVEHPYLGRHPQPGPPYRLSETPRSIRRGAPLLGEHTAEVLSSLTSPRRPVAHQAPAPPRQPLAGLRVLDFTARVAGPCLTKYLADHGAQVIKIEHPRQPVGRIDPSGLSPPSHLDRELMFAQANRNKESLAVDMSTEAGRQLVRRLLRMCDVVVENFSVRVMRNWGLDYPRLREIKPDIIMVSMPGFGQEGPYREYVSVGLVLSALTGMTYLWNQPHAPEPVGPRFPYPDYGSPLHGLVALLAALHFREATGRGQHIDVAQIEATAAMIGPAYMDALVNRRTQCPQGNVSQAAAPHGCYSCQPAQGGSASGGGKDRWCVISVESQEEWNRFCQALGQPPWCQDRRFQTPEGRLRHREELDSLVEAWTSAHTPQEVMECLQEGGVAAGVVANSEDLYNDPHLRARGFIVELEHQGIGGVAHLAPPVRLSATPGAIRHLTPRTGEHTVPLLQELLGLPLSEIEGLRAQGIIR